MPEAQLRLVVLMNNPCLLAEFMPGKISL
jgi:hypothetical protein